MSNINYNQKIAVQIVSDLSKRFNGFIIPDGNDERLAFISLWISSGEDYGAFSEDTYRLYLDFITNFWGYSVAPSSRQVFEWIVAAKGSKNLVLFCRNLKSRYGSGWRNDTGFEYSLYCSLEEQNLVDIDYKDLIKQIANHPNYATFAPNANQVVQCALLSKYADVAPIIQKTFRKVLDPKSDLYNNPLIAETRRRIGLNVIKNTQENALKKIFLDTYSAVLLDYNSGDFKPHDKKKNIVIEDKVKEEGRKNASFILSLK